MGGGGDRKPKTQKLCKMTMSNILGSLIYCCITTYMIIQYQAILICFAIFSQGKIKFIVFTC